MDPQLLRERFATTGVLLLLDSPEHMEFGIDNISWQIGNKFKGLKLIPLGTHIITYSLKNQNYMFPVKKFIYFGKQDDRIWVYRWNNQMERFVPLRGEEAEGYREGVKKYHFDSYLGPYPDQNINFWNSNTKYINKSVLDKLDPIEVFEDYQEEYSGPKQKEQMEDPNIDEASDEEQIGDVAAEVQDIQINEDDKANKKQENLTEVKKNKDFGGNIYYSNIPRRLDDNNTHTTQINIDRTPILESVIKSNWSSDEYGLLGEIQYSFVCFLIGQCLDSYNQWKQLIILMSSSEHAFNSHRNLMLDFIAVLYEQISQFPEDFFVDELAKGNFMGNCLGRLKSYGEQGEINKKAQKRIDKLIQLVNQKFGYQAAEDEEESPMIVAENQSYF